MRALIDWLSKISNFLKLCLPDTGRPECGCRLYSLLASCPQAASISRPRLRRTVTIEDVGNAAAFLCSDLASGITGEITYVDAGYSILGMTGIDSE